jgi:hypothetical protein
MLLRFDDRGVLAIGQASHAWISGQLGRAWGNDAFGEVVPLEEICLAAEQHDIGMAVWDLEPAFNPDTGFPLSFIEMPIEVHLRLWAQGPRRLLRQSRYAALLASMHGTRLFEKRDLSTLTADQAERLQGFFADQGNLERGLLDSLRADPLTAETATDARIGLAVAGAVPRLDAGQRQGRPDRRRAGRPRAAGRRRTRSGDADAVAVPHAGGHRALRGPAPERSLRRRRGAA